ncbi:MAG: 6-bladed beta-propeller [Bacteroidota bacterium]|nr:hypothetical protein [Odoribacter sp.]MDP3644758.1 6-bladed beta-propeller [Bacteroidota bacterium]
MKNILLLIFLVACVSCGNKKLPNLSNYNGNLKYNKICQLSEKPNLLGQITSINFIDSSHFVISTKNSSNVFIYNTNGDQIKKIAKIGKGPNELLSPTIVRVYDSKIYVWCANLLKLVVFDINGNPLNEYVNFKKGLKNFEIFKNYFCCFTGGGFKGSIISIFDMNKNVIIKEYGNATNEQRLLSILEGAGGISLTRTGLLYSAPDQLSITSINLSDWSESTKKYFDNEFVVKKIDMDGVEFFNSKPREALEYIYKNSIVTGIFPSDNGYILKTEVGEYSVNKNIVDFSKRYDKFYFLDKNMKLISALKVAKQSENLASIYATFGNHIYNVSLYNKDNKEYYYQLNGITF